MFIIVKFDDYIGLFINDIMLGYVFICLIIVIFEILDGVYER